VVGPGLRQRASAVSVRGGGERASGAARGGGERARRR